MKLYKDMCNYLQLYKQKGVKYVSCVLLLAEEKDAFADHELTSRI